MSDTPLDAPFNSLSRGRSYTFVFGAGLNSIRGIFHGIHPDGLLRVAGNAIDADPMKPALQYLLNPATLVYARWDDA